MNQVSIGIVFFDFVSHRLSVCESCFHWHHTHTTTRTQWNLGSESFFRYHHTHTTPRAHLNFGSESFFRWYHIL